MRRRKATFETMNVSFLDVISCALGGVLLLLLVTKEQSAQDASRAQEALDSSRQQILNTAEQLADVQDDLQQLEEESEIVNETVDRLKKAQATLAGLQGEMKNIVFLLDLSGSMVGDDRMKRRFENIKQDVGVWLKSLDFESFNVIGFGEELKEYSTSGLVSESDQTRGDAADRVSQWQAKGGTPTLTALKRAFSYGNIDTIVLLTDGMPNTSPKEILSWLRSKNANQKVAINTVAIGNYSNPAGQVDVVRFMQEVAEENGGAFSAR